MEKWTNIDGILDDYDGYCKELKSRIERLILTDINRAKALVYSQTMALWNILVDADGHQLELKTHYADFQEIELRVDGILENQSSRIQK